MKNILFISLITSSFLFSCDSDDDDNSNNEDPIEETLVTYSDIEFAQDDNSTEHGRFYSTSDGKMYKSDELNDTNGPTIDVVFQGSESSFIFFESPDDLFDSSIEIPGATSTKVTNFESGFSVADFDAMTDSEPLKNLDIVHDNESIGSLDFPLIVLFENAAGKKGAIKLKAINSNRLLVDIKVEK